MLVLITGAAGKVGQHLIDRLLDAPRFARAELRAFCHNREIAERPRVSVVRGSIADREAVAASMRGVTHVVHLATCKETPADIMDVAIKGLFWLLEEFRASESARRFVLIGGDASVGHMHHSRPQPITEASPHMAYPGCYALSKVLEEVMVEQFGIQYGLDWCCLRAPWIMEKDDFKYSLSFGRDVFGGPQWRSLVPADDAEAYRRSWTVPVLCGSDGQPMKRNFVHVDDLASAVLAVLDNSRARGKLYNICMDEPVDYGVAADYLARTRGLASIRIPSGFHSTWLDNSRARFELAWRPGYDARKLIDSAWDYERLPGDERKVWYPG